jgi:hypothetical protein
MAMGVWDCCGDDAGGGDGLLINDLTPPPWLPPPWLLPPSVGVAVGVVVAVAVAVAVGVSVSCGCGGGCGRCDPLVAVAAGLTAGGLPIVKLADPETISFPELS